MIYNYDIIIQVILQIISNCYSILSEKWHSILKCDAILALTSLCVTYSVAYHPFIKCSPRYQFQCFDQLYIIIRYH